MRFLMFIAMAAAMAFAPARAYTPESGVWWNPNEPGTGWQFEIQDNFISIIGYTYDDDGFPLFVTAAGFMTSPTLFQSTANSNDGSWLNTYANGQCIGCAYTGFPDEFLGSEGQIVVQFDPLDPTQATLTWGGRTIPIERFHFYLKRAEDGAAPVEATKMLGEWNVVVDVVDDADVQYYGDVLVFDDVYLEDGVWFFEGCRPETSIDNVCTDAAFEAHPVVGFYDTSTGFHQMVVVDYFDTEANSDVCVVYDVQVGTNDFRGGWDGNFDFDDDGGAAYYYCPQPAGSTVPYNGNFDFYPLEGWRTASRTAVEEGDDVGPSRAKAKATRRGPAVSVREDGAKQTAEAMPAAQRARLGELLRKAEARLRDR